MAMTLNEFIERDEGRRAKMYHCSAGRRTIGVGRNMDANPLPPDIQAYLGQHGYITEDMIDSLLEADIRHATADAKVIFPAFETFSQPRQWALISFIFQLGFTGAKRFTRSVNAINEGRWEDAANFMMQSLWAKQTPVRAKRITQIIRTGELK
jgi:lysozyme